MWNTCRVEEGCTNLFCVALVAISIDDRNYLKLHAVAFEATNRCSLPIRKLLCCKEKLEFFFGCPCQGLCIDIEHFTMNRVLSETFADTGEDRVYKPMPNSKASGEVIEIGLHAQVVGHSPTSTFMIQVSGPAIARGNLNHCGILCFHPDKIG